MYKALENSLLVKDRDRYDEIRKKANSFNSNYTGSNIIQDDIFHIVENYVIQQDKHMEMLRYRLGDDDLCACTFIRDGRVFVVINTEMTLSKQIFAAAHELYHLYNYFEGYDSHQQKRLSILDAATMDETTSKLEDMEANAFAGAILAPGLSIREQMGIFQIRSNSVGIREILMLMEIYAIPFKAMVLRLFEEEIIGEEQVRELFKNRETDILRQSKLTGRAIRWQRKTTDEFTVGSLYENMERVAELDAVQEERYRKDKDFLIELKDAIQKNK